MIEIMINGEVIVHSMDMVRRQEDGGIAVVLTSTPTTTTNIKEVGGLCT